MSTPPANNHGKGPTPAARDRRTGPSDPANGTGPGALIGEAQSLRDALRAAYGRASRLVAALKRQRKHSKLMATTLASLKQLQQIDA